MKLHLLEAPLSGKGSIKQFETDLGELLGRKVDVVGLSNVTSTKRKALIRTAKKSGYNLVSDNEASTALLVKHELDSSGFTAQPGTEVSLAQAKFTIDGQAVVVVQAESTGDAKADDKIVRKGVALLKRSVRGKTVGFLLSDAGVSEISDEKVTAVWEERKRPSDNVGLAGVLGEAKSTRIRRWAEAASVAGQAISFYYELGDSAPAKTGSKKAAAPSATAPVDGEVLVAPASGSEDAVKEAIEDKDLTKRDVRDATPVRGGKKATPWPEVKKKAAAAKKTTRKRAAKKAAPAPA